MAPRLAASRRTLLGGGAATLALSRAHAEPRQGLRRIGVLAESRADSLDGKAFAAVLTKTLDTLGWHEGDNLRIDWRWSAGDSVLYERYASELVADGEDVLLAAGSLAAEVLRQRTDSIPIVFVHVTDPVRQGFVASLAHPGGNITGFSIYDAPMAGKWLELLTQVTPRVNNVAVLFNPATTPYAGLYLSMLQSLQHATAVTVEPAVCNDDRQIAAAVAGLASRQGGLLVLPNAFATVHRDAILRATAQYRVPTVYASRPFVAAGGLMSYGIDVADLYVRAAGYLDRILKGAKPADLPVQQPTKFELMINLKTAKALGITIAPALLAQADEVIE